MMENIRKILISQGFDIDGYSDDSHIYAHTNTIMCLVVAPHSGTDNKYMIRYSTRAAFDRWSNSTAIQKYFDTERDLARYILVHYNEILCDLLEYLTEEYSDLDEDYKDLRTQLRYGYSYKEYIDEKENLYNKILEAMSSDSSSEEVTNND